MRLKVNGWLLVVSPYRAVTGYLLRRGTVEACFVITKRSSIQCLCSFRGFVPTEASPPRATLWKSPHARQAQSRLWVWPSPPRGTKCHGVRDARSLQDGGAGGKYVGSAVAQGTRGTKGMRHGRYRRASTCGRSRFIAEEKLLSCQQGRRRPPARSSRV